MDSPDTYFDLFLGYTAIWAIIAFFLFRLVRQQGRLGEALRLLEHRLERSPDAAQPVRPVSTGNP